MSSAATHGFLPLLCRDESIRLQLGSGALPSTGGSSAKNQLGSGFRSAPTAVGAPGRRLPGAPVTGPRRGIEEHVADAGFRYFFTDAHMAGAGRAFKLYGAEELEETGRRGQRQAFALSRVSRRLDPQRVARWPR